MAKPFFQVGPVPGTVINSPGELDAMVSGGQPLDPCGMTWRSDTAPDIATYPIFANFIWIDTSGPSVIKRTYNTALFSWDPELPADGSITGDMIADDTIPLTKLKHTAGLGGYVVRLNAGSTAFILDNPLNLFADNTFAISRLVRPAAGNWVLYSDGTTNSWSTVNNAIPAGGIALSKLATAGLGERKVLSYLSGTLGYNLPEALVADNIFPLNTLALGSANAIPTINGAGTAWTFNTPAQFLNLFSGLLPQVRTTALLDFPSAVGRNSVAHGLGIGLKPSWVRWVAVAQGAVTGRGNGEEVELASFMPQEAGANLLISGFSLSCDTSNLYYERTADSIGNLAIGYAGTGVTTQITESDWKLKAYYSL